MAKKRELTRYEKLFLDEVRVEMEKLSSKAKKDIEEKLEIGYEEAREIVTDMLKDSWMVVGDPFKLSSILDGEEGAEKIRNLLQEYKILRSIKYILIVLKSIETFEETHK